jgi:hypothetical protein
MQPAVMGCYSHCLLSRSQHSNTLEYRRLPPFSFFLSFSFHVCFIIGNSFIHSFRRAAVAQSVRGLGYGLNDRGSIPGRGNYDSVFS